MNGKGDTYRPVKGETWRKNYDAIFRKRRKRELSSGEKRFIRDFAFACKAEDWQADLWQFLRFKDAPR